ncbi:IS66 family insertion sequence element accessory protein TnpB [Roseburia sp. AM23-20]|nr:IS66 family insertion sequence element accessory protein TnpB [Roseburia sp. AM23-20]
MLGDISVANDIYIVCGYTDMRKSIDGLCAIIID